ncbi:M23 family metallopeptidase [Herbiconiux moechotypicola]|uniref:M23ase beta-sheet core domain-containing protein n=1 Tax=Herbiconiux moechotypicola TaxID=637393 RepID=A0ABN3DQW1_9MICO|nr:M23 family metallopeptidase [Herbiconiux moechotypicola]MCS5731449.1 M23 family metallopeptidase [Herbiconiux moechotypicola]
MTDISENSENSTTTVTRHVRPSAGRRTRVRAAAIAVALVVGATGAAVGGSFAAPPASAATVAAAGACAAPQPETQVHYELPFSWESTGTKDQQNLFVCGGHKGVDFGYVQALEGEPVSAVASGRVVERGYEGCHGNYVVIKHPDGVYSAYAHLGRIVNDLAVDSRVELGQHVGTVGRSGGEGAGCEITGAHLHLSMASNWSGWNTSDFFDPKEYIGARNGDGYGTV